MSSGLESVGLIQVLPLNMWPQHKSQFSELVFLLCTSPQSCQEDLMKSGEGISLCEVSYSIFLSFYHRKQV